MTLVVAELAGAWLAGRSISRSVPAPIAIDGGFQVETRLAHETRRYLFPAPGETLRRLGATVREPLVFLKLLGNDAELRAQLPACWSSRPSAWMMIARADWASGADRLPSKYAIETDLDRGAWTVRIVAADRGLAAGGRAAEHGGVFVYDQIAVDSAHRRRGLGGAVMRALSRCRRDNAATDILVATRDGRALYESLGWRILSPYSTAVIEPD